LFLIVAPAQAGLRRRDAVANIGEADGPKGVPQERRVIHLAFGAEHGFPLSRE